MLVQIYLTRALNPGYTRLLFASDLAMPCIVCAITISKNIILTDVCLFICLMENALIGSTSADRTSLPLKLGNVKKLKQYYVFSSRGWYFLFSILTFLRKVWLKVCLHHLAFGSALDFADTLKTVLPKRSFWASDRGWIIYHLKNFGKKGAMRIMHLTRLDTGWTGWYSVN